jgi:hypothetical protein
MYIKKRKHNEIVLSLDSLMDILACTVGLVIVIVVFMLIQTHGVRIQVGLPLASDPPENAKRVIILCTRDGIRCLKIDEVLLELVKNMEKLENRGSPLSRIELAVEGVNKKYVEDVYFEYKLIFTIEQFGNITIPFLKFKVTEKPGVTGETAEGIVASDSHFQRMLSELDPADHWLAFSVDSDSLNLFKAARRLAREKGFAVGWDPNSIEVPFITTLFPQIGDSSDEATQLSNIQNFGL